MAMGGSAGRGHGPKSAHLVTHLRSLMQFEEKSGFATTEGEWIPKTSLQERYMAQSEQDRIKIQERFTKIPKGLVEDKHAAAKELMQKLTDVKRMGGRKPFDFDHVYAETKALADGGCLLSKCKLASMRPEYQEELMDIYGEDLDLVQFKLDAQTFAILVSESGGQCTMGTMVMCVATSAEDPKLIFSCGYGELLGGGFEGEAIEVDAHIAEAREASGFLEKLSSSEFLACLLTFALSPEGRPFDDLADCDNESGESPTTPVLNKACKLISPTRGW